MRVNEGNYVRGCVNENAVVICKHTCIHIGTWSKQTKHFDLLVFIDVSTKTEVHKQTLISNTRLLIDNHITRFSFHCWIIYSLLFQMVSVKRLSSTKY